MNLEEARLLETNRTVQLQSVATTMALTKLKCLPLTKSQVSR